MEVYNMSYTEELKKHIASLFDKSTDQEVIKQYALVENEIGKLDEVLNQKDAKEMELLKDLKEAYIHTSVKPQQPTVDQSAKDIGAGQPFDGNAFISEFLKSHDANGGAK